MQTVFRADDGTIFEKEIDCESYESRKDYEQNLLNAVNEFPNKEINNHFMFMLNLLIQNNHSTKLINFIKSIGEQNADTSN